MVVSKLPSSLLSIIKPLTLIVASGEDRPDTTKDSEEITELSNGSIKLMNNFIGGGVAVGVGIGVAVGVGTRVGVGVGLGVGVAIEIAVGVGVGSGVGVGVGGTEGWTLGVGVMFVGETGVGGTTCVAYNTWGSSVAPSALQDTNKSSTNSEATKDANCSVGCLC